jgi:hypothetical protein
MLFSVRPQRAAQKVSPATCRASSLQKGRLLLLRRLLRALLAIALILLRGGLGLILRGGLGGFIGTLLLIGHSITFRENLKTIFRYIDKLRSILGNTMAMRVLFILSKKIGSFH